jgi:hypothetical protein
LCANGISGNGVRQTVSAEYVYTVMWNLPGCLPEMEPIHFVNQPDAWEFLADEFTRMEGAEFEEMAFRCEERANYAVMAEGDWAWNGPDGYVYSITCQDNSTGEFEVSNG